MPHHHLPPAEHTGLCEEVRVQALCSVLRREEGGAQRELAWLSLGPLTDARLFHCRVLPRELPGLRRLPAAQDDPHLAYHPQEVWNPIQPGM